LFLRRLSRLGKAFYERYDTELDHLFQSFQIKVQPPLKFTNTSDGLDQAERTNFIVNQVLNGYNKVKQTASFENKFTLDLEIKIDEFKHEEDSLNLSMFKPTS